MNEDGKIILSGVTQAKKNKHMFLLICSSQLPIFKSVCLTWGPIEARELERGLGKWRDKVSRKGDSGTHRCRRCKRQ